MQKLCFVPVVLIVGYACLMANWCSKNFIQLHIRCAWVNIAGGGSDIQSVAIESPPAVIDRRHCFCVMKEWKGVDG